MSAHVGRPSHPRGTARHRRSRQVAWGGVTTPLPKGSGFVRNACVHNHYVNPNWLSPSHDIS